MRRHVSTFLISTGRAEIPPLVLPAVAVAVAVAVAEMGQRKWTLLVKMSLLLRA
jgi:hypothetical protein